MRVDYLSDAGVPRAIRNLGGGTLRNIAFSFQTKRQPRVVCHAQRDADGTFAYMCGRRVAVSLLGTVPLWLCSQSPVGGSSLAQGDLDVYRSDAYRVSYPASWEVTGKAGADVLFKDPSRRGVNIGVTILPVRIETVAEYGDLGNVSEKIIQAEKAKDGSLRAEMMRKESLVLPGSGVQAYDYEYEVGTTRGTKRILSRVCIRDRKLYVVNGTLSCGKVDICELGEEEDRLLQMMRQSIASFDVVPSQV